jgi:hypothetical protein
MKLRSSEAINFAALMNFPIFYATQKFITMFLVVSFLLSFNDRMMDNIQSCDSYINIAQSQTYRSYSLHLSSVQTWSA